MMKIRLLPTVFCCVLSFAFFVMNNVVAKEQKVLDAFSGDTIAGLVLGDDIFKTIQNIEKSQFDCNHIKSIHAEIKISDAPPPRTSFAELWQVTACTNKHEYLVKVKATPKAGKPAEYRIDSIKLTN